MRIHDELVARLEVLRLRERAVDDREVWFATLEPPPTRQLDVVDRRVCVGVDVLDDDGERRCPLVSM